ncbi:MAG: hypothetical protein V1886_00380 [archaeon]
MKDIETGAVHVKILPDEAVEFKRDFLEMQLHLLNILKASINIKELRKTEFSLKTDAKSRMKEITGEIEKIIGMLPVGEGFAHAAKRDLFELEPVMKGAKGVKEKTRIDAELREIKKQLEKLG